MYSVWSMECRGFESHPRQLIFLRKGKVTALGVLCCFALFVCLTLLASFYLPSHLSFKTCTCTCIYMYMEIHMHSTLALHVNVADQAKCDWIFLRYRWTSRCDYNLPLPDTALRTMRLAGASSSSGHCLPSQWPGGRGESGSLGVWLVRPLTWSEL